MRSFTPFILKTILLLNTIFWVLGGSKGASRWAVGHADGKWVLDWRGAVIIHTISYINLIITNSQLVMLALDWRGAVIIPSHI